MKDFLTHIDVLSLSKLIRKLPTRDSALSEVTRHDQCSAAVERFVLQTEGKKNRTVPSYTQARTKKHKTLLGQRTAQNS